MARVVVVKLGGSVITDKTKEFVFRQDVASALAEEIANSDVRCVVVHGGGSYGHVEARRYGLSSISFSRKSDGVWQTRRAMYELNMLVCKTMSESRLRPYPFSPFSIVKRMKRSEASSWLRGLVRLGMTPVTFGDVVLEKKGFTILSGDEIVQEISSILKPERCIFAMDVDGLYEKGTTVIIPEISVKRLRKGEFERAKDATGGMRTKVEKAIRIASMGVEVCFVSGYRRNEFAKALKGEEFYGTLIKK